MKNKSKSSDGVGLFAGLLSILFIGLKLTGHIDWPWWRILVPLWIPLTLCIILDFIFVVVHKD